MMHNTPFSRGASPTGGEEEDAPAAAADAAAAAASSGDVKAVDLEREEDVVEEVIEGGEEKPQRPPNDDVEFYEAREVGESEQLGSTAGKNSSEPAESTVTDDLGQARAKSPPSSAKSPPKTPPTKQQQQQRSASKSPSKSHGSKAQHVQDSSTSPPRSPPSFRSQSPSGSPHQGHDRQLSHVSEESGEETRAASPDDEPERALEVSLVTCPSCLGPNQGTGEDADEQGGGGRCPSCAEDGNMPLDLIALSGLSDEVAVAINAIRVQLGLSCRQTGVEEGAQRFEDALKGMAKEGEDSISAADFARAAGELGVNLRKRDVRPLLQEEKLAGMIHGGGGKGIRYAAVARVVNGARWWPGKKEIKRYMNDAERLRGELESLMGARIAAAVSKGQDATRLRDILQQAKSNPQALEELKIFLSTFPIPHDDDDVVPWRPDSSMTTDSNRERARLRKVRAGDPYKKSVSKGIPTRPMSVPLLSRTADGNNESGAEDDVCLTLPPPRSNRPILPAMTSPAPKAKPPFPYEEVSKTTPQSEYFWETWTNKVTGKEHAPQLKRRTSLGSSSRRSAEFAKTLATTLSSQTEKRKARRDQIWRKSPFPAHAIQYVRWQGGGKRPEKGETLLPGFDSRVPTKASHEADWFDKVMRRPLRQGSRYTDPLSGSYEEMTTMTQLQDTLKNQRLKNNMALEATDVLKGVRVQVTRGAYDKALQDTKECLAKYLQSGKYGEAMANDLGDPLSHVTHLIKHQVDKLILVAKDALTRGNYDLALSQIPSMREACIWLRRWGVTYPEARVPTHWEVRRGITGEGFPEGLDVIEKLTRDITEKQSLQSLEKNLDSAGAVYARLQPSIDVKDEELITSLLEDPSRRNKLPEDVIADGRTYTFLLDMKPAPIPADLEMGTQIVVRGERVLGSGRQMDSEHEGLTGAITNWNHRAGKYKVAYADDYEWIAWPTDLEIEIVTQPEEVILEAPGFYVRCVTHQHPRLGDKCVLCAFAVVPAGPPFDLHKMHHTVPFTATGAKTGSILLGDDAESMDRAVALGNRRGSVAVNVLPPDLLRPAVRYTIRDALTNEVLPGASVSFRHMTSASVPVLTFRNGEDVKLEEEGVYAAVASGGGLDGCPWSLVHMNTVWAGGLMRGEQDVMLSRQVHSHEELRIVVSWAKAPLEIDTHISMSTGETVDWELGGTWVRGVKLDMDVLTGAGPETATIKVNKTMGYSLSLKLVGEGVDARSWDETQCKVDLYDHTGLLTSFQAPKQGSSTSSRYWHVFALDGSMWKRSGKGLIRVNQVSHTSLAQLAVPGWTLFEAARRGHWDDLCEQLSLVQKGRAADLQTHTGQPLICPHRLAGLTSASGETLLMLVCSHDESQSEDPAKGNERLETPLAKQEKAMQMLLSLTVELEKKARTHHANEFGIPTEDAWMSEVKRLGYNHGFIFRLASDASAPVAVHILNILAPMVKRMSTVSPLKSFFLTHGEEMLLRCVEARHHSSLVPVLTALLGIDAVWERRQRRRLQTNDHVQVEVVSGSGVWHNAIIYCKTAETFEVVISDDDMDDAKNTGVQCDPPPEEHQPSLMTRESKPPPAAADKANVSEPAQGWWREKPNLSDLLKNVVPSKLKLRSRALERLQMLHKEMLLQVKKIDFNSRLSVQNKDLMMAEKNYKTAVFLVQDKSFNHLYAT